MIRIKECDPPSSYCRHQAAVEDVSQQGSGTAPCIEAIQTEVNVEKGDKRFNPARRAIIKKGVAVAAGVVATGVLLNTRQAHAAKASKSAMMYMDKPHGKQQCSGCVQFIPGKTATADGTCQVVAGSISPHGWCVAFTPKS